MHAVSVLLAASLASTAVLAAAPSTGHAAAARGAVQRRHAKNFGKKLSNKHVQQKSKELAAGGFDFASMEALLASGGGSDGSIVWTTEWTTSYTTEWVGDAPTEAASKSSAGNDSGAGGFSYSYVTVTAPKATATTKKASSAAVATTTTAAAATTSSSGGSSGSSTSLSWKDSAFQQLALASHNNMRALHNAADLTWDDDLAEQAQTWADGCSGQNLSAMSGDASQLAAAIKMWTDESTQYDYNNPGFSEATGHFTQLVWVDTTTLGCAQTLCSNGIAKTGFSGVFTVCHYRNPGNMGGQTEAETVASYRKNVLPASSS
ncbi:hypothetical protein JCM10207_008452 [Rhodosporidiobolus poonsookiae]